MTHPQQRALHTHRNHFLFADYYLDNRLPALFDLSAAEIEIIEAGTKYAYGKV